MIDKHKAAVPEESPGVSFFSFAVTLAVGIAEGVIASGFAGFVAIPGGFLAIISAHATVSVALATFVYYRQRRGGDIRLESLLAVTTPFLGPLGPVLTLFTSFCLILFRTRAHSFHEWYLSLFPESEVIPARELYELIVTGRARSDTAASTSFVEVLTAGTPPQKQAVIALVARHFRPAFTPVLKMALCDADPSVRVQAATAMARVENEFSERWLELEGRIERNPYDVRLRASLARLLDAYAFCSLHDEENEAEMREKALAHYRRAFTDRPEDIDIRLDLARLLLRLDKVEEAADLLKPMVHDGAERRVLIWYAESLYRLVRYDELRALCERHAERMGGRNQGTGDTLAMVVDLWAGTAEKTA